MLSQMLSSAVVSIANPRVSSAITSGIMLAIAAILRALRSATSALKGAP